MENVIVLVVIVFGFILGGSAVQAWQKAKKDRLRILEEAIRSGNVDAETKRAIVESLRGGVSLGRLMFGVGWIAFFVGIGLLFAPDRDAVMAGGIVAAGGLALVTLPIAYREVEARKRA